MALIPLRVMKGHLNNSDDQTKLSVGVVLPNGKFQTLSALVDFRCHELPLANPKAFRDRFSEKYKSPQRRGLLQADNETPLPDGDEGR